MTVETTWMARVERDGAALAGPDAVSYLDGQVSQDVAGLEVGGSAWSWILQPAGKVDALVRVTRTGPDSLLVDTDRGSGEAVIARLIRFRLRTKVEITGVDLVAVAVRGPGAVTAAAELAQSAAGDASPAGSRAGGPEAPTDTGVAGAAGVAGDVGAAGDPGRRWAPMVVRALWPRGEEAADVLVARGDPVAAGITAVDPSEWEAARIVAGVPAMVAELTERTIPGETGLVPLTVSFTKGCYTGQELVARIDSRGGNVPRHLRGLRADETLEVGASVVVGDKTVGTVTSAAVSPSEGPVGLAYVGRAVAVGTGAVTTPAGAADGEVTGTAVRIVELPDRA